MVFFAPRVHSQIKSASITNILLKTDGDCDNSGVQTQFNFDLTIDVTNSTDTYSYHLIDGDNRVLGWQLALSGDRTAELRVSSISSTNSIAPYRIVIFSPSIFHNLNSKIDPLLIDYSSVYFDPHLLDSDCPEIICKGQAMDSTYLSNPPDQSIPVFIDRDMELENFSLSHHEDFFAGQGITLSPGYDSGGLGRMSTYDILDCKIKSSQPCWDLNENGTADINEDVDSSGTIDADDCN